MPTLRAPNAAMSSKVVLRVTLMRIVPRSASRRRKVVRSLLIPTTLHSYCVAADAVATPRDMVSARAVAESNQFHARDYRAGLPSTGQPRGKSWKALALGHKAPAPG